MIFDSLIWDKDGETALTSSLSVKNQFMGIIELLVSKGANIELKNEVGSHPL